MSIDRKRFDHLLNAICHGEVDRCQMEELAALLRRSDTALDEYLLQIDLHAVLADGLTLGRAVPKNGDCESRARRLRANSSRRRRSGWQAVGLAAAVVCLVLTALAWVHREDESRRPIVVSPTDPASSEATQARGPSAEIPAVDLTTANVTSRNVLKRQDPVVAEQPNALLAEETSSTKKSWTGTTNLYPLGSSRSSRTQSRLLPTRYQVPKKYMQFAKSLLQEFGRERCLLETPRLLETRHAGQS